MRVKALVPMYYDRRMVAVGEMYDMDDREEAAAKLLEILGKIELVNRPPAAAAAEPRQEEPVVEQISEPPPDTGKRTYRRRDMRAER